MELRLASAAFVLVAATYLFLGAMGVTSRDCVTAADASYNTLARGLLSGHLYADKQVPAEFARLADPYDPAASERFRADPRYRMHDFSYYGGRLYLYFGIAPALLFFIPWHLLTGGWMAHWVAVALACSLGVLVNASLVLSARRVLFPRTPAWVTACAVLLLGFASYGPLLAARADMWEVPIAVAYLMVSLALRLVWQFQVDPRQRLRWLALAGASFGIAFASRPTVLPAAAALLLPLVVSRPKPGALAWVCSGAPLAACGALVGAYNQLRFGSPFEFGMRYQLANEYVAHLRTFGSAYAGANLRLYLLAPVRLMGVFPFVREPLVSSLRAHLPEGHGGTEHLSGALRCAPVLWAALAVPILGGRRLLGLAAPAAWTAAGMLALVSFFFGACSRYQFEFVPWIALLACLGILCLEDRLRGGIRVLARAAWVGALALSCAFTVLYGVDRCVTDHNALGFARLLAHDLAGAEAEFSTARVLAPANPSSRLGAAWILVGEGEYAQAEASYRAMLADFPNEGAAHFSLANLLRNEGRLGEAIPHYREAHRLEPDDAAIERTLRAAEAGAAMSH